MKLTSQFRTPLASKMRTCNKEEQILAAAEALFTSRRFHEVTMDDVSRKAGVGKGTIYRYFKDKDDLFASLVNSGFRELISLIRSGSDGERDFEKQLTHALLATRGFFRRRRSLFRMMSAEEGSSVKKRDAQSCERRRELVAAVSEILRRGADKGFIRDDIQPELLAGTLLGMLRGFYSQMDEGHQDEKSIPTLVGLFLQGAEIRSSATRDTK